jgi:hypothetical protein
MDYPFNLPGGLENEEDFTPLSGGIDIFQHPKIL